MITKFYISTSADFSYSYENPDDIGPSAPLAKENGMGLELAEYCITYNIDDNFENTDRLIKERLAYTNDVLFHAPYNELCPAAIDPMIREVAKKRYLQVFPLAKSYGAKKIVVHSGFDPMLYRREWFVPESVEFWKDILEYLPEGMLLTLENVMEPDPEITKSVVSGVNDPRFRLCLDIGHANLMPVPVSEWINVFGDDLSHLHVHNNDGPVHNGIAAAGDKHRAPGNGVMDVKALLKSVRVPVTATLETQQLREAVAWVKNVYET